MGSYFKGGIKPIRLCVSAFDRAAPHGTGHIKAGLNYAMSLHAYMAAHAAGFDENMFLDAATRTHVEETGGANFLFVKKDGTVVTPKSPSILPSVTRRSLVYIAEHVLGLKVEHRPVAFEGLNDFAECGLCGTAAVISPIGSVTRGLGDTRRQGDRVPERHGAHGTCAAEALRYAARHPARYGGGTGGVDPQDLLNLGSTDKFSTNLTDFILSAVP